MPSSRCSSIPTIVNTVRKVKPSSILDIGAGFGKWGVLFREYTDIIGSQRDPARYERKNWQVRIDGIEVHEPYITPLHRFIYNTLYIGDARTRIHDTPQYDIVFLGDVIEHLPKDEGAQLLRDCLDHANWFVLVTTPAVEVSQDALCGNEYERHRSFWTPDDFAAIGRCVTAVTEGNILAAALLKPGVAPPQMSSVRPQSVWVRLKNLIDPRR